MSAYRYICFLLSLSFISVMTQAENIALTPLEIMWRVNTVDMGDNASQDLEMTLIDQKGYERVQRAHVFRKRLGDGALRETRTIMFFYSPDSVDGMGFFVWDQDDPAKEDRQWIYMPRMKQTKRIASNDKRLSFMGSDFSHADMALRNVQNYNHRLIEEKAIDGHKVWVIESIPINQDVVSEDGYIKSISSVRQDNFVIIQTVNHVKQGGKEKHFSVLKLEKIDGIWVQTDVSMETRKGGVLLSKTRLKVSNVKFNQNRPDEFFSVRSLEQGLAKTP